MIKRNKHKEEDLDGVSSLATKKKCQAALSEFDMDDLDIDFLNDTPPQAQETNLTDIDVDIKDLGCMQNRYLFIKPENGLSTKPIVNSEYPSTLCNYFESDSTMFSAINNQSFYTWFIKNGTKIPSNVMDDLFLLSFNQNTTLANKSTQHFMHLLNQGAAEWMLTAHQLMEVLGSFAGHSVLFSVDSPHSSSPNKSFGNNKKRTLSEDSFDGVSGPSLESLGRLSSLLRIMEVAFGDHFSVQLRSSQFDLEAIKGDLVAVLRCLLIIACDRVIKGALRDSFSGALAEVYACCRAVEAFEAKGDGAKLGHNRYFVCKSATTSNSQEKGTSMCGLIATMVTGLASNAVLSEFDLFRMSYAVNAMDASLGSFLCEACLGNRFRHKKFSASCFLESIPWNLKRSLAYRARSLVEEVGEVSVYVLQGHREWLYSLFGVLLFCVESDGEHWDEEDAQALLQECDSFQEKFNKVKYDDKMRSLVRRIELSIANKEAVATLRAEE